MFVPLLKQSTTAFMNDHDQEPHVVVEIDSQELLSERGFYVESLKHLDKYYDIFNNPNTCKKRLLTTIVCLLIVLVGTLDIVSNGFLIAYFYFLNEDGGGEFLITFYCIWLGLSHFFQTSYYMKSDQYTSMQNDHSKVRLISLLLTTWFMLPYIRLYDTLRNNDILIDYDKSEDDTNNYSR